MRRFDVLIVGAGHAGAQAAVALRQRGFEGTIGLLGAESELPYERPPLSKDYLAGERAFERLLIRPSAFWAERSIDLLLGRTVAAIDPEGYLARLLDGESIGYGKLIWAAGGVPRRLPCAGHDLRGVHGVRSRADVDRMIAELPSVRRVVVIGGGYIGLEAAAVMIKMGKHVTLIEAQDRILARVAGEELSRFYENEHRAHGVTLHTGAVAKRLEGHNGAVTGVVLVDGTTLKCEMVVVGIGIIPTVEPLLEAGAVGVNGVHVDGYCRTSLADIFAIGDCAAHSNRFADNAVIRLESVQNANDQATTVAKCMTGREEPYDAVPWFWSNQFDLKLQTVGLSRGFEQTVVRGDTSSRSFSVVYLMGGRVIALDCVNATKDYVQGRSLVEARAVVGMDELADVDTPLKTLL